MDTRVNSSSNSSLHPPLHGCHNTVCTSIFTSLFLGHVALIPLFVFVLHVGRRRRRRQTSVAAAAPTTSHSDVLTFNMAALELIGVLAFSFYCIGIHADHRTLIVTGSYIYSFVSPGQSLFHLLTCVDRYLAAVHPVTYLGLRQAGGVRIRNISVGCVWLLCFVSLGVANASFVINVMFTLLLLVFSSVVVSFCSVSVLRVLIRPGPGEVGGNSGERVDQSKQRAFHTIMAIMGALLLRFLSSLVVTVIHSASVLSSCDICFMESVLSCFYLPSSLVLPLLFLHRAGKLPGCKHNTQSG